MSITYVAATYSQRKEREPLENALGAYGRIMRDLDLVKSFSTIDASQAGFPFANPAQVHFPESFFTTPPSPNEVKSLLVKPLNRRQKAQRTLVSMLGALPDNLDLILETVAPYLRASYLGTLSEQPIDEKAILQNARDYRKLKDLAKTGDLYSVWRVVDDLIDAWSDQFTPIHTTVSRAIGKGGGAVIMRIVEEQAPIHSHARKRRLHASIDALELPKEVLRVA